MRQTNTFSTWHVKSFNQLLNHSFTTMLMTSTAVELANHHQKHLFSPFILYFFIYNIFILFAFIFKKYKNKSFFTIHLKKKKKKEIGQQNAKPLT